MKKRIRTGSLLLASVPLFLLSPCLSWASSNENPPADLTDLSIEELMNIEVMSATKSLQPVSDTSAAIHVITQEDIRRSGATTVPEILRTVPGVHVAQIDANKWAVSIRGFNGRFANKLLILVDGRTVYSPVFAGTYWDAQDLFMDDIDRIEVIRGPGATLWGANAVNGIINIITKNADATLGGLAYISGGNEERAGGGIRYGARISDTATGRLYAKYAERDGSLNQYGDDTEDDYSLVKAGFRFDLTPTGKNALTLQGDINDNTTAQRTTLYSLDYFPSFYREVDNDADLFGANILARWVYSHSLDSVFNFQFYYDKAERDEILYKESTDAYDLDFSHQFNGFARQEIVWGLGYHYVKSSAINGSGIFVSDLKDQNRYDELFSAFIQDDIDLWQDRFHLILGTKFEHNEYSGNEVQPNVRLLYKPHERHTLWGAVSRAVHTPTRIETEVPFNYAIQPLPLPDPPGATIPAILQFRGDEDFASEELTAYEAGYRFWTRNNHSFDIAIYYNDYDNLRSTATTLLEIADDFSHAVLPIYFRNNVSGETYGAEFSWKWLPVDWCELKLTYAYFDADFDKATEPGSEADASAIIYKGASPQNQIHLHGSFDLSDNWQLDVMLRYVDELPATSIYAAQNLITIDDYINTDIRIGWKPLERLDLSLTGRNLFDDKRTEFIYDLSTTSYHMIERSVLLKAALSF